MSVADPAPPAPGARSMDPHTPNPMHHRSGPRDAWSTVNTRENYPGVMSPLGATLWLPISDLAVSGTFHDLGVLRRDEIRVATTPGEATSAVFYGRYTAGLNYFRRISDLVPGSSAEKFERQIFGVTRADGPSGSTVRRYPAIALKAPGTVARLPGRMRRLAERSDRWWRRATSPAGPARPAEEQLRAAEAMLEYAMRVHMSVSVVAQALFDALAGLAERAGRPGLHLAISGGYGGMVELELVAALRRVARGEATLEEFLGRWGFRCAGEVEVANPSWRERPEPVRRLVERYRTAPGRDDLADRAARRAEERVAAERELVAALPRAGRPAARRLIALAGTFVPLREEGKAALARAFDGARAACGARGAELVAAGILDRVDDVFYLTRAETPHPPSDARALVAARRALRATYERLDVPDTWIGAPEPIVLADPSAAQEDDTVQVTGIAAAPGAVEVTGIAAAPGVVEGRVRVLVDADRCDELEPDEVLVCRTTDPSWASAFHLVAAAVIDVGSISSHGAIVAREMGLPCVIGTGRGTAVLRTGDQVRVDGGRGVVTLLGASGRVPARHR